MLFNSIDFAIFLPVVALIYWFALSTSLRLQNIFVVVASYVFYGWWDWRFLTVIIFSTFVDYLIGRRLATEANTRCRKLLLCTSVVVNLGLLGIFKYFDFFLDNFTAAFSLFGAEIPSSSLSIVLPVGISFYTFQTLSYTIDVYHKRMEPTRDLVAFAAFVSFFPQLVAGPIERASSLLPQFQKKREFDSTSAADGLRQILWGLFKKVVIADNCAFFVNDIFNNSTIYSGSTLALGAVLFAFQIYGDFSGYSDIAIGTSRLFGFELKQNFAFPYFSRDIGEFWRRWHISLSTWFRDYLYIPLGGSRGNRLMQVRNIFLIFCVSGFWHGANWTFVVWGALHAICFLPLLMTNRNRTHMDSVANGGGLPSVKELFSMCLTFSLVTFAWIFFRAESMSQAISYVLKIFSMSFFEPVQFSQWGLFSLISAMLFVEWCNRGKRHGLERTEDHKGLRLICDRIVLSMVFWAVVVWQANREVEFIYFQF